MFDTIKNLIGRNGNPSKVAVGMALGVHAKDIFEAVEEYYISAAEPGQNATIRLALRNGKLLPGVHRFPFYLLFLADWFGREFDFDRNHCPALAGLAVAEYSGKETDSIMPLLGPFLMELGTVHTRLAEQIKTEPMIFDSETILCYVAMENYKPFAALLRDNKKARLPVNRTLVQHIILGLGDADVTEHKILDESPIR